MGLAIFETYSQSTEGTRYAPFIVTISQYQCFDKLKAWVKENGFEQLQIRQDFHEIFAVKDEFEYTFTVTCVDENSLVNVSVFGQRGKTRKLLIQTLDALVKYFS